MAKDTTKEAPKPPQTDADKTPPADTASEEKKADKGEAPKPKGQTHDRKAVTRVKYNGKRYAPGDVVPFESAEEAEKAEKDGAVKPKAAKK